MFYTHGLVDDPVYVCVKEILCVCPGPIMKFPHPGIISNTSYSVNVQILCWSQKNPCCNLSTIVHPS